MSMRLTYFVHGTTMDNERDICTGWNPGELSPVGRVQAYELGVQVAGTHFDMVYCSDLKRAMDSAELGFGDTYTIVQDARLRECNYGDCNGMPEREFKEGRMKQYIATPFPHGESYKDVERRMVVFLDEVRSMHDGQHVAIVAHQAPQLALDVLVKGKSWEQAIDEDWRHTKAWQPGWDYLLT